MGMFDDLIPSAGGAAPAGRSGMFDDLIPGAQAAPAPPRSGAGRFATDVARSVEAGADRGIAGLMGAPADVLGLLQDGYNAAQAYVQGRPRAEIDAEANAGALIPREALAPYGGEAIYRRLGREGYANRHEPETTAGRYAKTAAEFGAQAAAFPGGVTRNVIGYGVIPGLASEAAGQATEGTEAEPYARVGAGLAAGLGTAGALRFARPTASDTLARASGDLAPPERTAALGRFDQIMGSAQENGIPLSPAFAWDAATNGASDMAGLYRHAEALGRMRSFNAQMPDAVEAAGRAQFGRLAPLDPAPTQLGARVSDAARDAMAATPEGQAVTAARAAAGPRMTPMQAGEAIQGDLRARQDALEAARATQAAQDYGAARAAPENVGIERMITVERPGESILTQAQYSRPQFTPDAPRPFDPPPTAGGAASTEAGPESLARFVARNGGIRLDGEAAATDLHRYNIPGMGNVARPTGKGIDDYWRESLIEHGYLRPDADGGAARDITSELLRKLQNEQRGFPSYPIGSGRAAPAGATAGQMSDEYGAALSMARSRMEGDLRQVGIDPASVHPAIQDRIVGSLMRGEHSDGADAFEAVVGALREPPAPFTRTPTITEEIPDVRFGQVDPRPALAAVTEQARTAKGDVRGALAAAGRDLREAGGELDMSVAGLLHARERLDYGIQAAREAGDATKVRDLQITRSALDDALKQVPEVATADRNFAANSRPLEPFGGNAPLGRVTQRDPLSGRMATPAEQVPSFVQGATAAREALGAGTDATRQALGQRLQTQILDGVTDARGNVSADRLRAAMRESEDVLAQMPEVRERLAQIASAQDGLDGLRGTLLGRLAERDATTAKAINTLFPRGGDLLANGEREVGAAVQALARQNPTAARQLVRAKAENLFNSATKDVQGGPNQMGGAKFAAQLVGNPQEAANFAYAVRALPEGDTLLDGFGRFLDVLRASGRRQNVGSRTAYNEEFLREAREGGKVEGVARLAGGGFVKFPAKVQERLERWRLGRNVDELARLFSDPDAIGAFRGLVAAGDRGGDIRGPVARLVAIAGRGAQGGAIQPQPSGGR